MLNKMLLRLQQRWWQMYNEGQIKEIGKKIKILRAVHQIRQQELARKLGISQTHLSNIEHGRVTVGLVILLRLANILHCTFNDFFTLEDESQKMLDYWDSSPGMRELKQFLDSRELAEREERKSVIKGRADC